MFGRPYMVGIAGPSCSGKSLIARRLRAVYAERRPVVLSLDAYYHDLSGLKPEERERRNFDSPEANELDLLQTQLEALARGDAIEHPRYDFATHTRLAGGERVVPGDLVVVEGLFSLYWEPIRRMFHTRVFVSVSNDITLFRRISRDLRERGRTREAVLRQYEETVRPMTARYILPTCDFAHVVVNGEDPVEATVERIIAHMGRVANPGSRNTEIQNPSFEVF